MSSKVDFLDHFLHPWMTRIGAIALILLTGIICGNMFIRLIYIPIKGTYELAGFFGSIVVSFTLSYTQSKKGHIGVGIFASLYPKRVRNLLESMISLIGALFFSTVAWHMSKWGNFILKTGELSETLRIPFYPFVWGIALGFGTLALVLFLNFFESIGFLKTK